MSKRFDLGVDAFQAAAFLSAVRTKKDVIVLWMTAIKAFLANTPASGAQLAAELSIVVSSMSRLFCVLQGGRKIFSIAFPFTARTDSGELTFYSREGVHIDSRISSQVLALIEGGGILTAQDPYTFIDPVIEATDIDPNIWGLLRELMLAEDAYLRYDWDEERADGHIHPEHHIDVFYTSSASLKVGLLAGIDQVTLVSMLDADEACHYLHAPRPANAGTHGGRR